MKFKLHPSICKIKENTTSSDKFYFRRVTIEDVAIQTKNLNSNKVSPVTSTPVRTLRENYDVFCTLIQNLYNYGLSKCICPKELKAGDISQLVKKEDNFMKKNYRIITVLQSESKIYERVMQDQMVPSYGKVWNDVTNDKRTLEATNLFRKANETYLLDL